MMELKGAEMNRGPARLGHLPFPLGLAPGTCQQPQLPRGPGCSLYHRLLQSLTANLLFSPPVLVGRSSVERSGLPKGCLLYKTLQVQKLDLLDIEGLYPLYRRVERYLEEFPEQR